MSIADQLIKMEQTKTIGNIFEWNEFKKQIFQLQIEIDNKNKMLHAARVKAKKYKILCQYLGLRNERMSNLFKK